MVAYFQPLEQLVVSAINKNFSDQGRQKHISMDIKGNYHFISPSIFHFSLVNSSSFMIFYCETDSTTFSIMDIIKTRLNHLMTQINASFPSIQ